MEAAWVELVAGQLSAALIGSSRALNLTHGQSWTVIHAGMSATVRAHRAYTDDPVDVEHYEQIGQTLSRAKPLMADRNVVVHSIWDRPSSDGYRASFLRRRYGHSVSRAWSIEMLNSLRDQLRVVAVKFGAHLDWVIEKVDE